MVKSAGPCRADATKNTLTASAVAKIAGFSPPLGTGVVAVAATTGLHRAKTSSDILEVS